MVQIKYYSECHQGGIPDTDSQASLIIVTVILFYCHFAGMINSEHQSSKNLLQKCKIKQRSPHKTVPLLILNYAINHK